MPNKATQLVQLIRSTKRDKRLGTVILFVTSRCNAFCQTCFYHAELNQPGDLTFAQIEKVSRTMPAITDLWLSGGEPTLRRDVTEIIDAFVKNNGVRRIIIPTNGLIKNRVYEIVDKALSEITLSQLLGTEANVDAVLHKIQGAKQMQRTESNRVQV